MGPADACRPLSGFTPHLPDLPRVAFWDSRCRPEFISIGSIPYPIVLRDSRAAASCIAAVEIRAGLQSRVLARRKQHNRNRLTLPAGCGTDEITRRQSLSFTARPRAKRNVRALKVGAPSIVSRRAILMFTSIQPEMVRQDSGQMPGRFWIRAKLLARVGGQERECSGGGPSRQVKRPRSNEFISFFRPVLPV